MGVCCEPTVTTSVLTDLPAPKSAGCKDLILKWELENLPWHRCYFKTYLHHLEQAKEKSGGGDEEVVDLQQLAAVFNTQAWRGLKDKTSKVRQFLDQFETEQGSGSYDYEILVIIGLLYCKDQRKPKDKAMALYNLLQDGGKEKHPQITANDKDWAIIADKMFEIATITVWSCDQNMLSSVGIYTEEETEKLK